jgi:hypothetical protein
VQEEAEEAPLEALTQDEAETWLAGVTASVLAAAPARVAVRAARAASRLGLVNALFVVVLG